ncbi:hypothetical protein [Stenotrophomonas phage BUCTxx99]|nr:hypothetical protein [Stenotrophomonas phage BUCTxx99]
MMKAKNLTRKLAFRRGASKEGFTVLRHARLMRGNLPNDEIRYITPGGALMIVEGGEDYYQINFTKHYTGHHAMV